MSSEQNPKTNLKEGRRSSLKTPGTKPQDALVKLKEKRNSVSWGKSDTFQFKQMKATFQESKEVSLEDKQNETKHKEFVENRRKSIKDEFSLVKEALKKKIIEEEDDEETNDELKKNTENNIKMGKDALNEESSSSSSSENSDEEK